MSKNKSKKLKEKQENKLLDCPINNSSEELEDVIKMLSLVRFRSEVSTSKILQAEDEDLIKVIIEIAEVLKDVDEHDIEFKDHRESMVYLMEKCIEDKFLNADVLKMVHIVFDVALSMAMIDALPNESLRLVYHDDQLCTIALGINTIAEGIYDGAKSVLDDEKDEECQEIK